MKKKKIPAAGMETTILQYLHSRNAKSYKIKEISHALHISKHSYQEFQQALTDLQQQGKIVKLKDRRIGLPSSLQRISGTIQLTKKGFGFVLD